MQITSHNLICVGERGSPLRGASISCIVGCVYGDRCTSEERQFKVNFAPKGTCSATVDHKIDTKIRTEILLLYP